MQAQNPTAQQLLNQIWEALQRGDAQQAVHACQLINQHYPRDPNGWYASSYVALQLGGPEHALKCIDQALSIQPGIAQWLLQKARCLQGTGATDEAIALTRELAAGGHGEKINVAELGLLASSLAEYEMARKLFAQAIEADPDNGRLHFNLATVLRFTGDLDGAQASCERAIELNTADYDALFLRSGLRRQTDETNHVGELRQVLEGTAGNPAGDSLVSYALAKELEDLNESAESFKALQRGARARRSGFQYSVEEDVEFIDTIREVYSREFMSGAGQGAGHGHDSSEPIFVIGLPRTGTTLVERILSSHDQVISAGELTNFTRQVAALAQAASQQHSLNIGTPTRSNMVRMTAKIDFAQLGKTYLDSTRPHTGQSAHFIDKFPQNSLNAGAIHRALPKAKIVLLQRHPMDSCYSMYKQLFTEIYQFSYDLDELGRYFIAHQALMNHWMDVLGDHIHVVRYEDLITDTGVQVRKLLEYCELPWQPECLEFQQNTQASTTASASQVRQKLYSTSIGKWEDYAEQLEPLRLMLEEAGCLEY